jgi:hypothetical protein
LFANNGVVLNMGYGWIFDPPKRGLITSTVNVSMLLIQWFGVLLVGGIVFFIGKTSSEAPLSSKVFSVRNGSSNVPQDPESESLSAMEIQTKNKPGPRGVGGWLPFTPATGV